MITNKPGLERKFWKVFLFTIITFGIYLFYWLYRNLTEMETAFEFEKNETQIIFAKRFYGAAFFIVLIFLIAIINIVVDNPENIRVVFIYSYYFNVIFTGAGLLFFYYFIKSVFLCQSKLKLTPFNKKAVYSMYIIRFLLDLVVAVMFFELNLENFVNEIVTNYANLNFTLLLENANLKYLSLIGMLSNAGNIVVIIFVYRLQLEINSMWTCYKTPVCVE